MGRDELEFDLQEWLHIGDGSSEQNHSGFFIVSHQTNDVAMVWNKVRTMSDLDGVGSDVGVELSGGYVFFKSIRV